MRDVPTPESEEAVAPLAEEPSQPKAPEQAISARTLQGPILISRLPGRRTRIPSDPSRPARGWQEISAHGKENAAQMILQGLEFFQNLEKRLSKLGLHEPVWEIFSQTLQCTNLRDYIVRQNIRDLDMFLRNFLHFMRNHQEFLKEYGFPVHGVVRRDEVELIHLGLKSIGVPHAWTEDLVYYLEIADAERMAQWVPQSEALNQSRIDADIVQCPAQALVHTENKTGYHLAIYLSRKLIDSVRYLHYRNGTLTRPSESEPVLQKIGRVLVYGLVRGKMEMMGRNVSQSLSKFHAAMKQVPDHQKHDLAGKSPEEQFALWAESPEHWNFPGVSDLFH